MVDDDSPQTSTVEKLEDILRYGIVDDLFHLEEARALIDFISTNAETINDASYGQFFGNLQVILGRFIVLQTAKLYEEPDRRYKTRNILSAVNLMVSTSQDLELRNKNGLIRSLDKLGCKTKTISAYSDEKLTKHTANIFKDLIQQHKTNIREIMIVRNKLVAHPEAIKKRDFEVSYVAIESLSKLAIDFVSAVGFAYFNIVYEDDSDYGFFKTDASRSAFCLKRLLQKAGVLEAPDYNI